jgi:hypothetical protein
VTTRNIEREEFKNSYNELIAETPGVGSMLAPEPDTSEKDLFSKLKSFSKLRKYLG